MQQNKNIIDAAAKVETLGRFVYSSLPNTSKLSGGKYTHVYHFEGKGMAEEYGRTTYPELWKKTNVFYAGYYLENYFDAAGGLFRPKLVCLVTPFHRWKGYPILIPSVMAQSKDKNTLILSAATPFATSALPMYSSVDDTGPLVDALFRSSAGHKVIGVNRWLSLRDFAEILAQDLGKNKNVEFIDKNPDMNQLGDPDFVEDAIDMMGWYVDFGFDGGKVDKSVEQPSELEVEVRLRSVEEWCRKQDWEGVLEVVD